MSDEESDLDTSSMSPGSGSDEDFDRPSNGDAAKSRQKTKTHEQNARKKRPSPKMLTSSKGVSKSLKKSSGEEEEEPYLKRLKLICRKVGIFVRNDIHFSGCTSDKQRIERLKEALWKAGMKGQPSLSKVDAVNLKREAAALDTSNIIETSGRPRRQPQGLFTRGKSPPTSLTPVKQQFSRIRDLIGSDSE